MTMVRTFEQKNLIEEDQFINKDGVYMVFEGFCGIYMNKKEPLVQVDAFGKDIVPTSDKALESDEETKVENGQKTHLN